MNSDTQSGTHGRTHGDPAELGETEERHRALAEALLIGAADTDVVVRALARALLATTAITTSAPVDASSKRDSILHLLGACALVESLECRAYRPDKPDWPDRGLVADAAHDEVHQPVSDYLKAALVAIGSLNAALTAAGPAFWLRYAPDASAQNARQEQTIQGL